MTYLLAETSLVYRTTMVDLAYEGEIHCWSMFPNIVKVAPKLGNWLQKKSEKIEIVMCTMGIRTWFLQPVSRASTIAPQHWFTLLLLCYLNLT